MPLKELYHKLSANEICEWMAYDLSNSDEFRTNQIKQVEKAQELQTFQQMSIKDQVFAYKGMVGHKIKKK